MIPIYCIRNQNSNMEMYKFGIIVLVTKGVQFRTLIRTMPGITRVQTTRAFLGASQSDCVDCGKIRMGT